MNITYRGRHNILYQLQSSEDRRFYQSLMGDSNGVWLYDKANYTTEMSDLLPSSGVIHSDVSLIIFDQYNTCCINFSSRNRQSIYTTYNYLLTLLTNHRLIEVS